MDALAVKGGMVPEMDQTLRTANSKERSHLWRFPNQTIDPWEQADNYPFKALFFFFLQQFTFFSPFHSCFSFYHGDRSTLLLGDVPSSIVFWAVSLDVRVQQHFENSTYLIFFLHASCFSKVHYVLNVHDPLEAFRQALTPRIQILAEYIF